MDNARLRKWYLNILPRPVSSDSYYARYGLAIASVIVVTLLYVILGPVAQQSPLVLFLAAVAISAWFGGLGPGLLATLLSSLIVLVFFLPPTFSFDLNGPNLMVRLALFILAALLINGLSYARSLADRTMQTERARLQVTLSSIGDAVISTDTAGRILFMNPVAEQLTGWSQADAQGRQLTDVFNIIQQDTRARAANPVARALAEGKVTGLSNHTLIIRRDGSEAPIEDTAAPIRNEHGHLIGVVLVFRDVSERKEVSDALQRSRDQLAIILRGVTDGITALDTSGKVIYANDSAIRTLGFKSQEELLAAGNSRILNQFEILDEEGNPFPVEKLPSRLALQGQQTSSAIMRWRRVSTGEESWALTQATPVLDEKGKPQMAISIFRDITEQRQADGERTRLLAEVEKQRERLATVIASIDVGVSMVDSGGRYVLLNDAWQRQTGYTREEAIGRRLEEFSTSPHKAQHQAIIDEVLATGEPFEAREFLVQSTDGDDGWYCDASLVPIRGSDGVITNVLSAVVDVTEKVLARKQTESQRAALRTIVEDIPIGVALLDNDLRIVDLNAEWARMTGIDMFSAPGRVLYDISSSFEERRTLYEQTLSGENVDMANVPYQAPGQQRMHYRDIHLRPVRDASGAITGMLNAVIDVTERHLVDQQKDALIAFASHELKTPITTIKGFAQISLRAASASDDERLERTLRVIDTKANQLTRLINEMLDVSRLQSGTLPLDPEPFDLAGLVKEVVSGFELTEPEFTINFESPATQVTVNADRQRIEQVVTNLLQNAIKYSDDSRKVEVGVHTEGTEAIVCVRDFGVGIPVDQQSQVFERFFRASNVASATYSGLGLGLHISHSIMDRHGGRMWLQSIEGKGSTFYFALPVVAGSAED